jgi:hypothetical protein
MPYPKALPENHVLLRDRDILGLSLTDIAKKYNVAKSTVSEAFTKMNRPFGGNAPVDYQRILPWHIVRDHQALDGALRLKAHIRSRLGLELTPAAEKRLTNWQVRLRTNNLVLDYRPEEGSPWVYVPRMPEDGDLVIRWPVHHDPPTGDQLKALTL